MWLFFNDHYQVPCLIAWLLVAFSVEDVLMLVGNTFINLNLDNFPFLGHPLSPALFAHIFRVDRFPLTLAVVTCAALLDHHPRAYLSNLVNHSTSSTCRTCNNAGSSFPATRLTYTVTLYSYFCSFSVVNFL